VVDEVGAQPGERVVDLCAAPGGKATGLAAAGARVIAVDQRPSRVRLMMGNVSRLGATGVSGLIGDGRRPPLRPESAERVLLDAPCSGLGVLHRRADARWRIDADGVQRLAALQSELLAAAADLVDAGGRLVYSVCTVTRAETVEVAEGFSGSDRRFEPEPPTADRWRVWGSGGLVLPQDHDSDGMAVFRWRRTS
jgi:16S rRNA (cytosine967-C5)-methyltransferase